MVPDALNKGDVSVSPDAGNPVNRPQDVGASSLRGIRLPPLSLAGDVLCHNVLSFDVRVLLSEGKRFVDLSDPSVAAYRTAGVPAEPYVFDTWSAADPDWIPLFRDDRGDVIKITAVQVTLRLWHPRSGKTRQSTMIQDL